MFSASQGAVDGDRLLSDIFANMSAQQIMSFLGVKQGTKGAAIISQLKQAQEWEAEMKGGKADGYRDQVAGQRQQGLGAAKDRADASAEARNNELVQAWTGPLQSLYNAYTKANKWVSDATTFDKQLMTVGGGLTAAAIAKGTYTWGKGIITSILNPGYVPPKAGPGLISTGLEATGALGRFIAANLGATLGPFMLASLASAMLESDPKMQKRARAYHAIPPEDWEAAHRKTQQWRTDPEGARGEAFNNITRRELPPEVKANIERGGTPQGEGAQSIIAGVREVIAGQKIEANVQGSVTGEATVNANVSVSPSPLLTAIIERAQGASRMPLTGKLGTSMGGSNGTKGSAVPTLGISGGSLPAFAR